MTESIPRRRIKDPGCSVSASSLDFRGFRPRKLLVQQRGSHAWTQEYPTVLDIDEWSPSGTRQSTSPMAGMTSCFSSPS